MMTTVKINNAKIIPAVGAMVRPVGSSHTYRVVSASAHGCYVEAVDMSALPGPQRRASLAVRSDTGGLFDNAWRAWEVV